MTKMVFCSNCGRETTNKNICDHCGSKIGNTDTNSITDSKNKISNHLWSRSIIYFFVTFALDIIGLSVIVIEFNSTQNVDTIINGIAILTVFIQIVVFYVIVYPGVDVLQRKDQLFYGLVPTIHIIVILLAEISISNNYELGTAFGYIVAWAFIGGIIHLYFRVRAIYDYLDLSGLTPEQVQEKNNEKAKREYNRTLERMATAEFRDIDFKF